MFPELFSKKKIIVSCYILELEYLFCVELAKDDDISDVKKAIKACTAPRLDEFASPELILYKPKKEVSDAEGPQRLAALSALFPNGQPSDLHLIKLHEGNEVSAVFPTKLQRHAIHIFISLPKVVEPAHITSSNAVAYDPTSGSRLLRLIFRIAHIHERKRDLLHKPQESDHFKREIYRYYFDPDAIRYPKDLTCSLTGVTLPSKVVIATHLWKPSEDMTHDWYGFGDIDNPRNGLLLYLPVKEAYDRYLLCFFRDSEANLRCRVLCKTLRETTFITFYANNRKKSISDATDIEAIEMKKSVSILEQAGLSTFGDLERPNIFLHFPTNREPLKRILNIHSVRAQNMVMNEGDTDSEECNFEFEDFYSEEDHSGNPN